jgi:hypothetical protein
MVRNSTDHYCFVTILLNEITGAKAKPGGDVMKLHGKKDTFFIKGEVFPLDKGLLMGGPFNGCSNMKFLPEMDIPYMLNHQSNGLLQYPPEDHQ